jgi:hypothetical protein
VRPVPIHLTAETIESGGPVEAPDLFRSATPENEVAIDLDLRDSPMRDRDAAMLSYGIVEVLLSLLAAFRWRRSAQ